MKKITEQEYLLDHILSELIGIKENISKEKLFHAGVGMGSLINEIIDEIDKLEKENLQEDQDKSNEDEIIYLKNKTIILENEIEAITNQSIEKTKRQLFELQDYIMKLINFNKIEKSEIPCSLNMLRNTGIQECDLKVFCNINYKKPESLNDS